MKLGIVAMPCTAVAEVPLRAVAVAAALSLAPRPAPAAAVVVVAWPQLAGAPRITPQSGAERRGSPTPPRSGAARHRRASTAPGARRWRAARGRAR
jgi:hypothetical protein